ncbi:hypothetical protein N0V88_000211 [Collariella sp. IMI 366227]|nr:hypothetical protein N0V88_000211 [Collariella sp. IMI 366227]
MSTTPKHPHDDLLTSSPSTHSPPPKKPKMSSPQLPLSATYTSSTNAPFTVSLPLANPATSTTVEAKTKYLSELRQAVTSLQATVNRELTARMEEDKAREASVATANGKEKKIVDDEKEEENYGEEVQEEED